LRCHVDEKVGLGLADGIVADKKFKLCFLDVRQSAKLNTLALDFAIGVKDFSDGKIGNLFKGYSIDNQPIIGYDLQFIGALSQLIPHVFVIERQTAHTDIGNLILKKRILHHDIYTFPEYKTSAFSKPEG
jgi:hypothetical protein